jgi:hypothetical protein
METNIMHAIESFTEARPQEITHHGDGCTPSNNIGSVLDLLKEEKDMKSGGQIKTTGEKSSSPGLPNLSLDDAEIMSFRFPGDGGRWIPGPLRPGVDKLQDWEKHWEEEAHKIGHKVERGFEKLRPEELLQVARDLAECSAKYGPVISADIAAVIASEGTDVPADIKLCTDLIIFARSPEAARLSEDAKKVLHNSMAKLGLPA